MACGIYKITNNINGKIYIGQSKHIERRWQEHKRSNANTTIVKAFMKYGIENFSFDIIEECSEDNLEEREKFYIKQYDSYRNGYNSTTGGIGKRTIRISEVVSLWKKGYSAGEIAKKIGVSRIAVANNLTAGGILPEERMKRYYEQLPKYLKKAKEIRDQKYPNGSWRGKSTGRPTKEQIIKNYLVQNPEAKKSQIKADLNISYTTIRKYYDKLKLEIKNLKNS